MRAHHGVIRTRPSLSLKRSLRLAPAALSAFLWPVFRAPPLLRSAFHQRYVKRAFGQSLLCLNPAICLYLILLIARRGSRAHPPDPDYNARIDDHDNKAQAGPENYLQRAQTARNGAPTPHHPAHQAQQSGPRFDFDSAGWPQERQQAGQGQRTPHPVFRDCG